MSPRSRIELTAVTLFASAWELFGALLAYKVAWHGADLTIGERWRKLPVERA